MYKARSHNFSGSPNGGLAPVVLVAPLPNPDAVSRNTFMYSSTMKL